MRHVTAGALINYIEGVSDAENTAIDAHLLTCKDCADLKQEYQGLITDLRQDASR